MTGLFFWPTVASYLLGLLDYGTMFGKDYSENRIWSIALVLNLMHLAYMILKRQLLPEHFPFSSLALFCWNDEQWVRLLASCYKSSLDLATVGAKAGGGATINSNRPNKKYGGLSIAVPLLGAGARSAPRRAP